MITLADAGPLIALIDKGQGEVHRTCVAAARALEAPLLTTWPCFSEAMYFLGELTGWRGQAALWQLVERRVLSLRVPTDTETTRMRSLMEKYSDTPMDLADASLVAAAESLKLRRVFTLDTDFRVYRINDSIPFEIVP